MKTLFWRIFALKLLLKACMLPFLIYVAPSHAEVAEAGAAQNMNRAMSGIIQNAMASRGYVPSDPRTYATLARTSSFIGSAAGGAAAIAIGTITAPAWLTFTLAAAAGGLISYGVTLAADSLLRWYFKPDQKIEVERPSTPTGSGVVIAGAYWKSTILGIIGSDPMSVIHTAANTNWPPDANSTYEVGQCTATSNPTKMSCGITRVNKTTGYRQQNYAGIGANYYPSGAPGSCQSGFVYREVQKDCIPVPTTGQPNQTLSPQEAVDTLTEAELSKPLNPSILAQLSNNVWQQAASQPGYDGLPYPMAQPITVDEVVRWLQQNPQYAPTVRDFVSPNPTTTDQPNPWALPSNPTAPVTTPTTNPNPGTTNPGSDTPLVNLGPDPGVGAPTLEQPPTARQIIDPILQLAPGLRNYQAVGKAGVCPRPTVELFGKLLTMESHCQLMEDNKPALQAAMTFAWTAMALFVILSA